MKKVTSCRTLKHCALRTIKNIQLFKYQTQLKFAHMQMIGANSDLIDNKTAFTELPSKKSRFFHKNNNIIFIVVRAKGLPVARFQCQSRGAAFPEQDHATVQAFHVELTVDIDAFRPERRP